MVGGPEGDGAGGGDGIGAAASRHLVIMGPMGVGKTVLAGELGLALGRPVRDSDEDIEVLFARTGRRIAAEDGVDALHDLEEAVLLGALASPTPSVIAAAGWVVEDPWCREALRRRAAVIVLELGIDQLLERMADGDHRRSVTRTELEQLGQRRRPLYDEVADLRLDAGRRPSGLVDEILGAVQP